MLYGLDRVKGLDYIYVYLHKQKQFEKIYFEGIDNLIEFLYRKYPKYSKEKYKVDSLLLYTEHSTVQTCLIYFDLVDGYIGYSEMHERAEEMFLKEWAYIDKVYTIQNKYAKERGYADYVGVNCVIKSKIQYMDSAIVQLVVEHKEEGDWSWNTKKEIVEALIHMEDLKVYSKRGAPTFRESIEKILKQKDEPPKKKKKKESDPDMDFISEFMEDVQKRKALEQEEVLKSLTKQIDAQQIEARTIDTANIYTMGDPNPSTRGYSRGSQGSGMLHKSYTGISRPYYELLDPDTPITEVVYNQTALSVAPGTKIDEIRSSMANIFPELKNGSAKQVGSTLKFYSMYDPEY